MMQEEAVHKRKWVSSDYFLEMLAATNIVPGPNATEMAAHLGYIRAGLPGLLAGGIGFILPGAALSLIIQHHLCSIRQPARSGRYFPGYQSGCSRHSNLRLYPPGKIGFYGLSHHSHCQLPAFVAALIRNQ